MILGAGRGTRLGEYGKRVPKILAKIAGRPLLTWQLEHLASEGFERAVVNTHHLASQVEDFAASWSGPPELRLAYEQHLLGTAGGLVNAWPQLGAEAAVVVYGDVLPGPSLRELLAVHQRRCPLATLAAYEAPASPAKGAIVADERDRITSFREKDLGVSGRVWINAGLMVVERRLTGLLAAGVPADFGLDLFPRALTEGADLRMHRLRKPVLDIGTRDALAVAEAWLSESTTW